MLSCGKLLISDNNSIHGKNALKIFQAFSASINLSKYPNGNLKIFIMKGLEFRDQ